LNFFAAVSFGGRFTAMNSPETLLRFVLRHRSWS